MADDGTRRYFAVLHSETATIEIKVFVIVKTFSSFFNYASSTTLATALNVSPRERKRVVLLLEVSKFLLAALFVNSRRVGVIKFRVDIRPI